MQIMMGLVLVFSSIILGLHIYITRKFPAIPAASLPKEAIGDQSAEPHRLSLAPGEVRPAYLACSA